MADIIAMRLLIFQRCDISIANNYTIVCEWYVSLCRVSNAHRCKFEERHI